MSEPKTKQNDRSVEDFLKGIPNEKKRNDAEALLKLMKQATRIKPKLWGAALVGFGKYHYKYASGREGDSCLVAFSPRKQNLTIYIMPGFGRYGALMKKLGKYKTGKSCLYINKLEDIDLPTLKELVKQSVAHMKEKYK